MKKLQLNSHKTSSRRINLIIIPSGLRYGQTQGKNSAISTSAEDEQQICVNKQYHSMASLPEPELEKMRLCFISLLQCHKIGPINDSTEYTIELKSAGVIHVHY